VGKGGYQQKRLQQKKDRAKQARRRARRRRQILIWGSTIAVFALIVVVAIMLFTGDDGDLAADGSPTPSPSPTAALPEGCTEASPAAEHPSFDEPPPMTIDPDKTYTAMIQTNCGTMTLDLFAAEAPTTVNSFAFLAREGFYDGVLFHRVIDDFMIQGGDPQGTGSGGPGYQFEDENTERQFDEPGLLAMANSGPGTNGSQFFITEVPIQHLNAAGQCPGPQGCHSIFGKVTDGLDVLQRIIGVQTSAERPLVDIVITTITIDET